MRISGPDDGDAPPPAPDRQERTDHAAQAPGCPPAGDPAGAAIRVERVLEHRAAVDAAYRAHAIDQSCARVERIERETVTPAMRRIEAADPDRHLAGLEYRLKERYRIEEKVEFDVRKWGVTPDQAFSNVKDAIRYTFQYPEERYAEGVLGDIERLKSEGFQLTECRNSWAGVEYKGINSRWRVPESGQLFEVQFHTPASFTAKQQTHGAYERLRTLPEDHEDVLKLQAFQREVTTTIAIPREARDIPNYP
jgi:hypothetical protein